MLLLIYSNFPKKKFALNKILCKRLQNVEHQKMSLMYQTADLKISHQRTNSFIAVIILLIFVFKIKKYLLKQIKFVIFKQINQKL